MLKENDLRTFLIKSRTGFCACVAATWIQFQLWPVATDLGLISLVVLDAATALMKSSSSEKSPILENTKFKYIKISRKNIIFGMKIEMIWSWRDHKNESYCYRTDNFEHSISQSMMRLHDNFHGYDSMWLYNLPSYWRLPNSNTRKIVTKKTMVNQNIYNLNCGSWV